VSDATLTTREKMTSLTLGLALTAVAIEVVFRLWAPATGGFNNEVDEYPTNPRGYFDEVRTEQGHAVYGVPLTLKPGTHERLGEPLRPELPVRILGLGDSQGMGQGVRFQDTAYEQMSELLETDEWQGRALNASVRGYDLVDIVARAKHELAGNRDFDAVIYTLVLDDFGLESVTASNPSNSPSAAVRFFAHAWAQWDLSERTTAAYLSSFEGERLDRGIKQLVALNAIANDHQAPLVIAIMPLLYRFDRYPFGPIHIALQQACETHNLACIDLLPALAPHDASAMWVHPTDHHPNETAHRLMAETMAAYVLGAKILPPQKNLQSGK
jgi:lysophospholipase L1-like esterase